MRSITLLFALALFTGCLADDPADPDATPTLPDDDDAPTLPDDDDAPAPQAPDPPADLQAFLDRIAALEQRLAAVESTADEAAWDVGNAALWLESITGDVVALQQHSTDLDAIAVADGARIDAAQAEIAAHADAIANNAGAIAANTAAVVDVKNLLGAANQRDDAQDLELTGQAARIDGHGDRLDSQAAQIADVEAISSARTNSLDDRVQELEQAVIALDPLEVDAAQTCEVGPPWEPTLYSLAVAVTAGQVLFLDFPGGGLEVVQPEPVVCGADDFTAWTGQPDAVIQGGQVYVLPAEEVSQTRGPDVPIWSVLRAG